jgi:hypothetical protein
MKGLSAIYFLGLAFVTGCSSIMLDNPHAVGFGGVSIEVGNDHNGGPLGKATVKILEIQTASGTEARDFPSDKPGIKNLYLKAGRYKVRGICERNWPNPPKDGSTYRLPYGLGTDDASETFTISIETDKNYLLDCVPGIDKSEFTLALITLG